MPPNMVYSTMPTGTRKHAAAVGTPVSDVTTADPGSAVSPSSSCIDETWKFTSSQQHGSHKDVGHETERDIHAMSDRSVTGPDGFETATCQLIPT